MAAFPRLSLMIRHLPTAGGLAAGCIAGATMAVLPTDRLEPLVWSSGIATLIPAAQPPLGMTARLLLASGGAVVAGAVAWAALFLLFGPGGFFAVKAGTGDRPAVRPTVRRADAHPDAPPRRPMTAADLGTPLMEVTAAPAVEQPLPRDLDQRLAAFDPAAVPAVAREPLRAVPPLAPGERLDTFALTPPPPTAPATRPIRRDVASAQSIDSLLRRLEEGAGRRVVRQG